AILFLKLGEEAHVFDGDDGLVGEGLEQCDLLFAEWPDLEAPHPDGADGAAFPQQRNADERSRSFSLRDRGSFREFVRLGLKVGDVDKASLDYGAPIAGSGNEGYRPDLSRAVMRDGAQDIALDAIDHGVEGLAEPSGALRDGVEHRLHVGRRT